MPMIRRTVLVICAALLAAAAGPAGTVPSTTVPLQSNPGTRTDATARKLASEDIAAAKSRGDTPLVLTGRANLGGPQPAVFVQLQSPQECGSAGCSTSVYSIERGRWARVLDSATGRLGVSRKKTRGRFDLVADADHFVWNGTMYRSVAPVPALNLTPRHGRR